MAGGSTMVFDLLARDQASKTFKAVGDQAVLAATKVGKATTAVERAGIRMGAVGDKLTKSLTLPIVALGAVAVDQAAKFQAGLNTIQVATDQTNKQMAASSKGLMSIAKSTGTSLDQLTTSLYTVEKGGLRGSKALDAVKASAQGARAEGADLGTAAQALTSIMASYGKSMSNPIQAENALIRGAGLAKTTYQDFASSLSNVVPVAAALHISFSQVAGAIDTMTQHGESAQRATENLANLITNLAGQNTVASSAMQQLGINTISLQKNLGTRGLTGTLAIVDAAMKAHTKNGMIVSSASKDAALATKSLDTEMGTFTGTLQKQSKGLLSGKVGITDYQQYAKSLGGTAGASALQFLALYKSSQGFSDQLKAGNGTIRTSAATLQKMLGGVTGMRTALMLGGTSAQRFAQDTSAVAVAANKAGANVLGWSKTQDTFNVKLDQAKEAMEVLAVQAGTELLPVLSKLASAGEKSISWISGLDHTQKELLGWGLGVVAAVGPVLSLTGRLTLVGASITQFSTNAVSQLARFNTSIALNAEGISAAAGRIGSAIGAAGLGVAVGELTKNSSTATKQIGVLGSALAGAAIGSAGGPWGIAIGAAAGAVGDLATQWLSSGHAAKAASAQAIAASAAQKQAVNGLYQSLLAVNGAYDEQYKKQVSQQLLNSGASAAAVAAHINPHTVLQATLGNAHAQSVVAQQIGADQKGITEYGPDGSMQYAPTDPKVFAAASKLNKILIASGAAATGAEKKYELYTQTEGKGVLTAAQLAKGVGNVSHELKGYGTSLDTASAYGARNTAVVKANVQALNQSATAQLNQGKGIGSVTSAYDAQLATLTANLKQMGFNGQALDSLVAKYAKFPTLKTTHLQVIDNASAKIRTIINEMNTLHNKSITITTYHATGPGGRGTTGSVHATAMGSAAVYHRPDGTIPPNTTFTLGEGGTSRSWEAGFTNAQGRATILSNSQAKAAGFATPRAYASGTKPNTSYTIGGTSYSTLADAIAGITKAFAQASREALGLGKAAEQGGSSLRSAFDQVLTSAKAAGISEQQQARLRALDNQAARYANMRLAAQQQVASLRSAKASDISTIHSAVTGSFNVATAGTGYAGSAVVTRSSIFAQARQAEVIAKKFSAGIIKLRKEGLALSVVQQLAQAGPSAYGQVEALLTSTPKQLKAFDATEAGISSAGSALGKYVGGQQYNKEIARDRAKEHDDALAERKLLEGIRDEIIHLSKAIENHPTILQVNTRKLATATAKGKLQNDQRR